MEELLAREREAEQCVHQLLKNQDEPILNVLKALDEYRQLCRECLFADFEDGAEKREAKLWQAHTDGKKYFHNALIGMRRQTGQEPVATRQLIKFYLQFIKDSLRFYIDYIRGLNSTFGGIPELESVAQRVKKDGLGESSQPSISLDLRKKVLDSCHQTLIKLGDLSRYRASEQLDKNPNFGPAIGYYGLACTLRPSSGMGHHQQAVIALEQHHHLRAIYHLYRAMVVEDPHPHAANNLKLEFERTITAWDRGELIQKGAPNDPEKAKRTLVGWFVRLHSMSFKGEVFRGYNELEREVLGQLAAEIKQRDLDATLLRMIMVNFAAQFTAGEKFQANPVQSNQDEFLLSFRFNIKTFTTLLHVFYDELKTVDVNASGDGDEVLLAARLSPIVRRILPALRLYSSWIFPSLQLLAGLTNEDVLGGAIDRFWPIYAKAIDLVAAVFPIWDLEDLEEVAYMLEEDSDTLCFKPLIHEKTANIWANQQTGIIKPRLGDFGVERASIDDENLARVKQFLVDGLYLANDVDEAPIKLRGTRILHRDAEEPEVLPMPSLSQEPVATKQKAPKRPKKKKPLSYAAAAANGPTTMTRHTSVPNGVSSSSHISRDAQLSRMVDDLVDDDDSNNPVTPPQQLALNPAVVTRGDVSYSSLPGGAQDFGRIPSYSFQSKSPISKPMPSPSAVVSALRTPKTAASGSSMERMQSVSRLWNDSPVPNSVMSTHFSVGLPPGSLSSPAQAASRGHSRVNSASSFRSKTSQSVNMGIADSWSSLESAPRAAISGSFEQSTVASPLLFGAGGGLWSAAPGAGYRNVSPPHGQGG